MLPTSPRIARVKVADCLGAFGEAVQVAHGRGLCSDKGR